jgi:DNA replication and repair protein RecF
LLEALHTTDFRNLASEPVVLPGGAAVLIGPNGAGKTSVLEAIGQLSGRPSFRGARPAEMAAREAYALRGDLVNEGRREVIRAVWSAEDGRGFFRGEKMAGYVEMAEALPAIVFSPDDRSLVSGSPSGRRRFLDRLAVTFTPAAAEEIAQFSRALAERNALLSRGGNDAEALSVWTEEFIRCAARVVDRRRAAFQAWAAAILEIIAAAGDPLGDVVARYRAIEEFPAEEAYRRDAQRLAGAERRRRHTLFGPQREDIVFERGGRAFAAGASSGEIARFAFYLRLAEARVTEQARRRPALYAVDEFDAHHAPAATSALLSLLPRGAQILLTSARPDAEMLVPWPVDVLEVDAGRIHPRSQPARLRKTG